MNTSDNQREASKKKVVVKTSGISVGKLSEPTKKTRALRAAPNREAKSGRVFLVTLWTICEDPNCDDVISWDPEDKTSFKIHDLQKFKDNVLPTYYTSKWHSFRRQLYFYGFKGNKDSHWKHPNLNHQDPETLNDIKRTKKGVERKRRLQEAYALAAAMQGNPMYAAILQQMYAQPSHQMPDPSMMYNQAAIIQNPMLAPFAMPSSNGSSPPVDLNLGMNIARSPMISGPMVMPMTINPSAMIVTPPNALSEQISQMPAGLSSMMPSAKRIKLEHGGYFKTTPQEEKRN